MFEPQRQVRLGRVVKARFSRPNSLSLNHQPFLSMKKFYALLLLCVALSCSKENPPGWVDQERLNNREAKDWLTLGGNQLMQHYSPLNAINKGNVQQLGFAWEYDA